MKTISRSYPKLCDHCQGEGRIQDHNNTSAFKTCPVCEGSGKVMVNELEIESEPRYPVIPFPYYPNPYPIDPIYGGPYKVTCNSNTIN